MADQGKELLIFLTKDCFVPVLKKVAQAVVSSVVIDGIPGASFLGRVATGFAPLLTSR